MNIEYSADGNVAVYCGYKFRKDPKTGYYLCTKKTDAGKRERLHVFVWRMANGNIPVGYHIHHKDENKDNNDISNLDCIMAKDHTWLHAKEYASLHREDMARNLTERARPKASEWHKSQEGRAWHKGHCQGLQDMNSVEVTCQNCGKKFLTKKPFWTKFCSNNCKSAARRKSGVDLETRKCAVCGREFRTNKYSRQKCCGRECSHRFGWDKRN